MSDEIRAEFDVPATMRDGAVHRAIGLFLHCPRASVMLSVTLCGGYRPPPLLGSSVAS